MSFGKIKLYIFLFFVILLSCLVYSYTSNTSSSIKEPSKLVSSKNLKRIRVGGKVSPNSITYITDPSFKLEFMLEDRIETESSVNNKNSENPSSQDPSFQNKIKVIYNGIKPDMFTDGRDVLVDGEFKDGVVIASSLLTQCPSKYEPKIPELNNTKTN